MLDCNQVRERVGAFIDHEMTQDSIAEMLEHLDACKHCFAQVEFMRIIKQLISKVNHEMQVEEPVREKILMTLRSL